MDDFLKYAAIIIVALILYLVLNKYSKDFSVLITIVTCVIVATVAISLLEPVVAFINRLIQIGNFDSDALQIMFKAVGIGLLSEIISTICNDAGNSALGKSLQIFAAFTILWLSIPLFTALINIIEEILASL